MPTDAPSLLAPARAAVNMYLQQVIDSGKRVLSKLKNTEYQDTG